MWRRLLSAWLDLLWPPLCLGCEREAWDAGPAEGLCSLCSARLEPPLARCGRCARPLGPFPLGPGCRRCEAESWPVEGLVAGQAYRGVARVLVVALKFRGLAAAARPLARRLAEALADQRVPGDLLVPVPLSRARRRTRGFNQATLVAREVARRLALDLDERALLRVRHDAAQSALAPGRRRLGPRGAFRACPERVRGRCVLLVDDVLTSGATALACARALYRAGALSVVIAVACRSEGHPGAERLPG